MQNLSPVRERRWLHYVTIPLEVPMLAVGRATLALFARSGVAQQGILKGTLVHHSLPEQALALRVFKRISQITGLPQERLMPQIKRSGMGPFAVYDSERHEVVSSGESVEKEHHEMLHATQKLLHPALTYGFMQYFRNLEPAAGHVDMHSGHLFRKPYARIPVWALAAKHAATNWNFYAAAAITGIAVGETIGYARQLLIRRAVAKYGTDGWIALHAYGNFDPLFSTTVLHSLERQGFINKRGFTEKGETWIKSLKPEIESRLKQMTTRRT